VERRRDSFVWLGADSLFDVSGTGSTDVWAVGDSVYCSPDGGCSANPYVIHWNGSKWDLVPGAPGVILNGVLAQTSTDVYVVGTYSLGTAIGHWDGRSWSKLPSPDLGEGGGLNGIAATGPNQFWSVGSFLDTTFRGRTLIEQAPSTTQGALIGGTQYAQATVTWIGPENGSTTTDIFGNYQAAGLPVGDYTVIVSAQGCSPGNASVKISAGETMIQNFHLQCH
jgi:hypothetical protein